MTELVDATAALVAATGQLVGTKSELLAWAVGSAIGGPNGDGRYAFTAADNSTVLVPSPAALLQIGQSSRGIFATTTKALSKGVSGGTITAPGSGGTTGTYALAFSGGGGSGAAGFFTVSGGKVIAIQMTAPGDSYTSAPTLSFAACPGLTGASGVATIATNVSVGQYFSVPVSGSNDALILYRVDAGPVATEVVRYPSSAVLSAIGGRRSAFIVPPSPASALWPLIDVQLFPVVGGVALAIPAAITVRDFARDNLNRFRLRLASYDSGTAAYADIAGESTSLNMSAAGFTGERYITLYAVGTSLGVPAGTVIGVARVDFGAGGTFGTYFANNIAWSVGGLYVDKLTPNAAEKTAIDEAIPANAAVAWLQGAAGLFKALPTNGSPAVDRGLLACTEIIMLPAYALTGNVMVRECARDAVSGGRFRFRLATWDGSAATEVAKESAGSAAYIGAAGLLGMQLLPLYAASGNPWGASTSTIVGYVRINFGAGDVFGAYISTISYAVGAVHLDRIQFGPPMLAVVNSLIDTALAAETMRESSGVFLPSVRNSYLEDIIRGISIEGGDKSHQYIISQAWFEYYPTGGAGGTPLYRWRIRVRDLTLGIDCCEYGDSSSVDPTTLPGKLEEWGYMTMGSISTGETGLRGLVKIDWSKISWATAVQNNYTLASQSGIDPRNVFTNDEMDVFLERSNPKRILAVGAAGDFTSVTAALQSLYKYGLTPAGQGTTLPWSNVCSFGNQVLIRVIDDDHHEDLNEALMVPYVTIRGKGIGNTIFSHSSPDTTERLLEFRHSGCIEDCTLIQRGPAYIVHSDAVNDWSVVAAVGPAVQRFRIRKVLRRVELIAAATTGSAWGWGSGISSGEYVLFEDCRLSRTSTAIAAATIGVHSSPNMWMGATVHFRRCVSDSALNTEVTLLSGFAQATRNLCIVEGGNLKIVRAGSSFADSAADMPAKARQRIAWDIVGDGVSSYDDDKMEVLKVAQGTAIGGTKAATLFGTDYDQKHGLGAMLVMEENTLRKLGAIIGDCSSVNQSISLGGTVHTLDKDYRAMTEAAILAELNGTFGAGAISVVPFDEYIVPLDAMQRRIKAAASVAKKRFVAITADKVDVTSGRPDGFTMFAMAADAEDIIVEDRRFDAALFPELVAGGDGNYGIVAGVPTLGASPTRLVVYRGLAELID